MDLDVSLLGKVAGSAVLPPLEDAGAEEGDDGPEDHSHPLKPQKLPGLQVRHPIVLVVPVVVKQSSQVREVVLSVLLLARGIADQRDQFGMCGHLVIPCLHRRLPLLFGYPPLLSGRPPLLFGRLPVLHGRLPVLCSLRPRQDHLLEHLAIPELGLGEEKVDGFVDGRLLPSGRLHVVLERPPPPDRVVRPHRQVGAEGLVEALSDQRVVLESAKK